MKGVIAAGAAVVLVALGQPARAQLTVFDPAAVLGISKQTVEEIKNGFTMLRQLQTATQQLQWAISLTESLVHNPNIGSVMALANMLGIDTSLPINPYAVQSLVTGYGGMNSVNGMVGKLSGLGSLVNTSYDRDRVYECQDNSFSCVQSNARAAGNAGVKGMVSKMAQDLQNHLPVLQGLRERLALADNPKDVADIQAQIEVEGTWVNNQKTQLEAVATLAMAQQQVSSEQRIQKINMDTADMIAAIPK